jgi:hypothetical protein
MDRFEINDQVRSSKHPGLWGTVVAVLPATVKVRWHIPNATGSSDMVIEECDPATLITDREINASEAPPTKKSGPLYPA